MAGKFGQYLAKQGAPAAGGKGGGTIGAPRPPAGLGGGGAAGVHPAAKAHFDAVMSRVAALPHNRLLMGGGGPGVSPQGGKIKGPAGTPGNGAAHRGQP